MSPSTPITEAQIEAFVAAWYRALNFHVPFEEIYCLLADEGLDMHFPDGDITDRDSFKRWYDRVIHLFFDQNHSVRSLKATITGDEATLDVMVGWQASWWVPPAAKSKRTSITATQRWTVRRSAKNAYGLEIVTYNAAVAPFQFAPGFARP